MKNRITAILAAITGLVVSACETTTSFPYQASTQNVITAQSVTKASGAKVTLGAFTAMPGVKKPTCRMMGEVDVAPGKSIEVYIREAMQNELFMAGAYDQAAPVTISGRLDEVSVSTVGAGLWKLTMTVMSTSDPVGYQVSTSYPFASSFSADNACKNAAAAFNPAVQEILGKVVSNPSFRKLVNG